MDWVCLCSSSSKISAKMCRLWRQKCESVTGTAKCNRKTTTTNLNFMVIRSSDKLLSLSSEAELIDRCSMAIHTANLLQQQHLIISIDSSIQSDTPHSSFPSCPCCLQTQMQKSMGICGYSISATWPHLNPYLNQTKNCYPTRPRIYPYP